MPRDYNSKTIGLIILVMLAALILLSVFICKPSYADTFYIDDDGSDSNTGHHPDTAMQTFGVAVCSLSAGDTLFIMDGIYNEKHAYHNDTYATLYVDRSGGTNNPIVFKGYQCRPRITGSYHDTTAAPADSNGVFSIGLYHESNLVFDSLILDSSSTGIEVWEGDSIVIKHCVIKDIRGETTDNDSGIKFYNVIDSENYSYACTIKACTISDITSSALGYSTTNGDGINAYNFRRCVIRDNVIFDGKPYGTGIRLKIRCDSIDVYNNQIKDCGYGIQVFGRGNNLYNNYLYDLSSWGIQYYWKTSYAYIVTDNKVYNNTLFRVGAERGISNGIACEPSSIAIGSWIVDMWNNIICNNWTASNTLFNNVVSDNHGSWDSSQVWADYNCYYDFGQAGNDIGFVQFRSSGSCDSVWHLDLSEMLSVLNIDSNSIESYPAFTDSGTTSISYDTVGSANWITYNRTFTGGPFPIDGDSPCATNGRSGIYCIYIGASESSSDPIQKHLPGFKQ